jgi:hypothetical protein
MEHANANVKHCHGNDIGKSTMEHANANVKHGHGHDIGKSMMEQVNANDIVKYMAVLHIGMDFIPVSGAHNASIAKSLHSHCSCRTGLSWKPSWTGLYWTQGTFTSGCNFVTPM